MTLLVACGLKREAAIVARPGWTVVAGGGDAARLEAELETAAVGGVSALLSCGVAGALDPRLRAGDVVVGSLHLRHAGHVPASTAPPAMPGDIRGDDDLEKWLARHLPDACRGTVIGSDTVIAGVAEKAALHAATGAVAVDMESHIAARVAARHGLPFAIVRTISDSADHALPPAALVGMRPDGGVAIGAVLAALARDPAQLPALIRTGRDAGAALRRLRRALATLETVGIGQFDAREFRLDM